MKKFFKKHIRTILIHMLFWISIWFLFFYFFNYNSQDRAYVIWFSSLLLPLTMAVTYFAIYFLIPKFLLTKKYTKFALFTFYLLVVSSYWIALIIYGCLFILKSQIATIPPMVKNFFFILILVYIVVVIVSFVTILNYNFSTEKKNKELQNKILNTQLQVKDQELQYLKMQIHPHFLFNTLNTIYGFAIKQSKQTPEIILMLSNLLDYILYQVNKPFVDLQSEVDHIKEYIELEKIRFQDTLRVTFKSENIDNNIQIAPMLLIPFVENAFKHGSIIDGFLKVDINISLNRNQLTFTIKNTYINEEITESSGIGLENIKKRLELNYANQYTISKNTTENCYEVCLAINDLNTGNNA